MSTLPYPDPRSGNGWSEYQKLVLAELQRHNDLLITLTNELQEAKLEIRLLKESNHKIKEMQEEIKVLQDSLGQLMSGKAVTSALAKYRGRIITGILTFTSIIIIPVVKLLFFS